jgi:lipopolysaccharide biosynthesis regulator YciM
VKFRTFFFVLGAMGAIYAVASLFVSNREVLEREIHLWGFFDVPISLALVLFLMLGVAMTLLAGVAREASRLMEERRRRKDSKRYEEIDEEYGRGLAAVLEGREDEALEHFRAVLERDSRHFNTLLKIGDVLRSQERYDEAIEFHRKAHHLKDEDTRALYALVEDYEAKGDLERARAVLGRIIAIKKHSVSAWRKLRALHIKERRWAKALEAHERVEKYAASSGARDGSERRFGLGIRYEMGAEDLAQGRTKEAVAAFRRVLKEDPKFVPAHIRLGEALRAQGLEGEAVDAWFGGFEATGSPVFLMVLEEHYLQQEQPLAAIEALKRCVVRARKDTVPRFFLGKLYFRLEMLDDALSVLTALEGRASYAPSLHYLLGRIHERRKHWPQAAAEYRRVIKELELVQLDYRCRSCRQTCMEWADRCARCGEWNTIEVNFREEIALDELGLSPAPVYTEKS